MWRIFPSVFYVLAIESELQSVRSQEQAAGLQALTVRSRPNSAAAAGETKDDHEQRRSTTTRTGARGAA